MRTELLTEFVLWSAAAILFLLLYWRHASERVGLGLAYVANLWLIHWPVAAIYLFTSWRGYPLDWVETGFRESTYAIISLTIGFAILGPLLPSRASAAAPRPKAFLSERLNLPLVYTAVGLICYTFIEPAARTLPTIHAVIATAWQLMTVGFALFIWRAWVTHRRRAVFGWLLASAILPILTAIVSGFMGHGAFIMINLAALVCTFYRPRRYLLLFGLAVSYVALSFFVTYMRSRDAFRREVWAGSAFGSRVEQMQNILSGLQFFDPANPSHLALIDGRLNQNFLVGAAAEHMKQTGESFANGATIRDAALALIPRALWPSKSVVAGSMGLVSKYTGLYFDPQTSVGMGQVFEFYINFGALGVAVGFTILGMVLYVMDRGASQRLVSGNWRGFAVWYLPGVYMLLAGGSLVDITATVAAAIVNATLLNRLLPRPYSAPVLPSPAGQAPFKERAFTGLT